MLTDVTVKPRDREPLEIEELESRHVFLRTLALVMVLFAIGAVAWYAYPTVKRYQAQFVQFGTTQKVVDGISDRVRQTDAKIEGWASEQQGVRDEIAKLRVTSRAQLNNAVKHAEEASSQVYNRIQAQIDERFQGLQTRLGRIEATTATDQARIAELRNEVDQARRDLAQQTAAVAALRQQIDESNGVQQRQLAALQATEDNARHDVAAIQQKLSVRRVDFEATKSRPKELADGISLNVTATDPTRHTLSGSVSVEPDRRTIWLRSQNTQQPVIFYGSQDGAKRELVITNVTRNSVAGYLLLPADRAETPASRVGE
jgi:peptidoglycan hydrolase CwlO-like protein